jgi:hypothetical protein
MHRDTFIRLKRAGPPSDPKSEHELMVFSSTDGRAGQVDHHDVFHLFAWVDEISGGGSGLQFDTYPQAGQYLYVETEGSATSPSGYGQEFYDHSGNGINLGVSNGGTLALSVIGGGRIDLSSTGGIQLTETNSSGFGSITINSAYGQMYIQAHDNLDIESAEWGFLHFRSTGLLAKTGHRIDVEAETVASFRALHGSVEIEAAGVSDSSINLVANGAWKHSIFGNPDSFMDDKPGHLFLLNTGGDGSRTEIHDVGAAGGAILRIDVDTAGAVTYHMKAGGTWIADLP